MATTKFSTIIGSAQVVPVVGVLESVSAYTIGATTTPPTPGTGSTFFRETYAMGNVVKVRFEFNQTVAGSGGSGNYTLPLSNVFTVDTQRLGKLGTPGNLNYCGSGSMQANTAAYQVYAFYNQTNNTIQIEIDNNGAAGTSYLDWGATANSLATTTLRLSVDVFLPITASAQVAQGAGLATSLKPGLVTSETSGTFNGNLSGNVSTGFAVCNWYKVGRMVTLEVDSITYTATAAAQLIVSLTNMPASARPRAASPTSRIVTQAVVSGTAQVAVAYAQPTILNFSSTITGSNWPASGSQTQQATVFSWLTD